MKLKWPIPETFAGLLAAAWCVFLYLDYRYSWNFDPRWKFRAAPGLAVVMYLAYKKIYAARANAPADAQMPGTAKRP